MNSPNMSRYVWVLLALWMTLFSTGAAAVVDNAGLLDNVLERYSTAAAAWSAVITARATWLFWTLAVISMVWTFGVMAIRKADIGEFYAEFVRFVIFTGFFWWALSNGPAFATSIMDSLRQVAADASGSPKTLAPSGIVDIGFDLFFKVLDMSTVWKPIDSACGLVITGIVLVVFALVGVNMLLLLVSGWILAYAGVFFLGFGGSRWTSDIAISYFKTVLNIAAQLFTMVLLVGIGKSFVDQYYRGMSAGLSLKELSVMLVVAVVLLALVRTIPGVVGSLAGASTGSLGSGFGVGAALGAAAVASAAMATAGAAVVAGAANMAGATQALAAAFSSANAAESAGGAAGAVAGAASGTTGAGGGSNSSALAAAMGNSDGGTSGSGIDCGNTGKAESNAGGEQSGSTNASSGGQKLQTHGPARSSSGSDRDIATSTGTNGTAPGEVLRGAALKAVGAMAAKAGRITGGTAANLVFGSWDVAKAKIQDTKEGVMGRIGETVGGKIASAIASQGKTEKVATFGEDSLSTGAHGAADKVAEVAAFRDRSS